MYIYYTWRVDLRPVRPCLPPQGLGLVERAAPAVRLHGMPKSASQDESSESDSDDDHDEDSENSDDNDDDGDTDD